MIIKYISSVKIIIRVTAIAHPIILLDLLQGRVAARTCKRFFIFMSDQPKKDWKVLERHYKLLSEVWEFSYKEQTLVPEALMILQGCLIEMHSDLIAFEQKNGNKSTQKSKDRLIILTEKIQIISSVQSDNYSLKYHNKKLVIENQRLVDKINDMIRIQKEAENI